MDDNVHVQRSLKEKPKKNKKVCCHASVQKLVFVSLTKNSMYLVKKKKNMYIDERIQIDYFCVVHV